MKKEIKISDRVYSKDFSIKPMGYCCEEVDQFLDSLNIEIEKLERKIEQLNSENDNNKTSYFALKQQYDNTYLELTSMKAQNGVSIKNVSNFNNIELYNRISNIETMINKLLNEKNKS